MVDSAIPVARATCAMPPYPIACASVAAHTRRDRSVRTGDSAACFARRVARSTSARYYSLIRSTRSYFLTGPNERDAGFQGSARRPRTGTLRPASSRRAANRWSEVRLDVRHRRSRAKPNEASGDASFHVSYFVSTQAFCQNRRSWSHLRRRSLDQFLTATGSLLTLL